MKNYQKGNKMIMIMIMIMMRRRGSLKNYQNGNVKNECWVEAPRQDRTAGLECIVSTTLHLFYYKYNVIAKVYFTM